MSDLQAALADSLRPLIRELVREELDREREQWRWRTVKQASEILDLSASAIYQRAQRGQIPVSRIGSKLYVDMRALDHQLDALHSVPQPDRSPRRGVRRNGGHDTRR